MGVDDVVEGFVPGSHGTVTNPKGVKKGQQKRGGLKALEKAKEQNEQQRQSWVVMN